jgi:hypothetical protein
MYNTCILKNFNLKNIEPIISVTMDSPIFKKEECQDKIERILICDTLFKKGDLFYK